MSRTPDPEKTVRNFLHNYFCSATPDNTGANQSFLAAVSGGADSVFLLLMLHRILPEYGFSLTAITVNHRMRSNQESGRDADFVEDLCRSLVPPVPCIRINLEEGAVFSIAAERKKGEEEAARFLRYRQFQALAKSQGYNRVCTGHTRDDQLETLLMRTLQGSGTAGMGGIAPVRGIILRPMLGVNRCDLEKWLRDHGYSWREDHTNSETRFLRNRIRSCLVPVLDEHFSGWKKAMLSGASKSTLDEQFIASFPLPEWKRVSGGLACSASEYFSLHPALRRRVLYQGFIALGLNSRVPNTLVETMIHCDGATRQSIPVSGSGLRLYCRDSMLFLEADIVQNRKSGYLVYVASCGEYALPFGTIRVTGENNNVYIDDHTGPFVLPLIVRSRQGGDTVQTAGGGRKTVKKLMNDWSVRDNDRDVLPIIECGGTIRAVYGTPLGYPLWYVHR